VPVLALNRVSSQAQLPPQLYQFGLSPENEAQQVAERIMLDGLQQGVALVPEGPWGERIMQSFNERLVQLGGELVDIAFYKANDKVFSEPTQHLLKIDESAARYKRLKWLLKDDIKFEQRRRQDIDFVFIAAFPRQARQIRPELKFFSAGNLPVYATSHVYSGKLDPARDNDMDGIIFGDIPWLLQSTASAIKAGVEQAWPQLAGSEGRLYAMGADAYNVLPYLKRLGTHPLERYFGETGVLQLDADRQLNRQLLWAHFVNGVPTRLQAAAVPATEPGTETTGNVPETTPQTPWQ
jgi:outer membrane PBP1 activator LpoA protein